MSAWYCGVDPSSTTIGLAAINDTTGEVRGHAYTARGPEPFRRLVAIRHAIRLFLAPLADDGVWCAVVERPKTHQAGSVLLGAFGVCGEATASALPRAAVHDLSPKQVDANASVRREPGVDRKASVRARARELGYAGDSQDVADAVVCAAAARTLTLRETGEAA